MYTVYYSDAKNWLLRGEGGVVKSMSSTYIQRPVTKLRLVFYRKVRSSTLQSAVKLADSNYKPLNLSTKDVNLSSLSDAQQ